MESQDSIAANVETGRWTISQQQKFLYGVMHFGKDWKKIQDVVLSRTGSQIRSHAQKFFLKLNRITKHIKKMKKKEQPLIFSELQNQFLKCFKRDYITNLTPLEIINLLHFEECQQTQPIQTERQIKNQSDDRQRINQQQSNQFTSNNQNGQPLIENLTSKKNQQKERYIQSRNFPIEKQNQQSSYLIQFLKQNSDYLQNLDDFGNLIEIKSSLDTNNFQTTKQHRKSFGLLNQEKNQFKLKLTLKKIKDQWGYEGNSS